jgi:hypothetical protein
MGSHSAATIDAPRVFEVALTGTTLAGRRGGPGGHLALGRAHMPGKTDWEGVASKLLELEAAVVAMLAGCNDGGPFEQAMLAALRAIRRAISVARTESERAKLN